MNLFNSTHKLKPHNPPCPLSGKNRWVNIFRPREAVNGFTHLFGALLSIPGLYLLIKHTPADSSMSRYLSLYVFGLSLFLLYSASATYHLLNASKKVIQILRRIDHMMIYVLIAGTYTPLCMIALEGTWRWTLMISIWSLAIIGIIFKLLWFKAPRWLSTISYILMGWMVVIALFPLSNAVLLPGIICLLLGGLFYTTGAIIYATKRPNINLRYLGFHEIFHLFVLAGSFSHFLLLYWYL